MIFSDGLKATGEIVQETPQDFFDFMNKIFRFDLDVCALPENAKCKRFYTPEDDGLKQPWGGEYGAIHLTGKTSSIGSGRLQRNTRSHTAISLSCFFLREQIRGGFKNMSIRMHTYGLSEAVLNSEERTHPHHFLL